MRLALRFDVNRQRITQSDLKWMRQFQRDLVSVAASLAYVHFAVTQDSALAEYFSCGEGSDRSFTFHPSEHLKGWYSRDRRSWAPPQTLLPIEAARDICCIAHWDEWMLLRGWALKVHMMLLQAHTRTQSVRRGDVTIITRMALPSGVNERCHATIRSIIDSCWFRTGEPLVDIRNPQDPFRQRVHNALDLRFAAGLIEEEIERAVVFEVSRLDPVIGRQDPDFDYEPGIRDTEMFVRLCQADCDLDNELRRSDADFGIEWW